jgi:hypothetical protein
MAAKTPAHPRILKTIATVSAETGDPAKDRVRRLARANRARLAARRTDLDLPVRLQATTHPRFWRRWEAVDQKRTAKIDRELIKRGLPVSQEIQWLCEDDPERADEIEWLRGELYDAITRGCL